MFPVMFPQEIAQDASKILLERLEEQPTTAMWKFACYTLHSYPLLLTAQLSSSAPGLTSLCVLPCSRRVSAFRISGIDHLGSVLGHQFDQPYEKTKFISVHVLTDARDAEVPPREAGQHTRGTTRM